MRVLVLCNDYPPLNSIAAQRPHSWVHYWTRAGHCVVVVTKNWRPGVNVAFGERSWDAEALESLDHGEIHRVRHRVLWSERFERAFGRDRIPWFRRTLTFLEQAGGFLGSALDRHSDIFRRARELLAATDFDVLVTTGEPFVLFRYGWLLKRRFGIRWVADYRDGWYANHVRARDKSLPSRLLRSWEWLFERRFLQAADLVTTVDPWLAERLVSLHRRPTQVFFNGFWEFAPAEAKGRSVESALVLVHAGTLTPGQRIEVLLDALCALRAEGRVDPTLVRLELVGLEYQPEQVRRILGRAGAARDLIQTTSRLDRAEAFARCCRADYLVSPTEADYKAIFAKTYDYLAARRPILVIPDDASILSDLVQRLGAGRSFRDSAQLKVFLAEEIETKRRLGVIPGSALDEASARFYTREIQAGRFADSLRELCGLASARTGA